VDDVAAQAGTICNEILTRFTSRLPRLVNGKAARSGGEPVGGGSLETDRT